jgi:hypothetical protein
MMSTARWLFGRRLLRRRDVAVQGFETGDDRVPRGLHVDVASDGERIVDRVGGDRPSDFGADVGLEGRGQRFQNAGLSHQDVRKREAGRLRDLAGLSAQDGPLRLLRDVAEGDLLALRFVETHAAFGDVDDLAASAIAGMHGAGTDDGQRRGPAGLERLLNPAVDRDLLVAGPLRLLPRRPDRTPSGSASAPAHGSASGPSSGPATMRRASPHPSINSHQPIAMRAPSGVFST